MQSLNYTYQANIGRWNYVSNLVLDSDVEAIQLVAKKTGATANLEYVLVDVVRTDPCRLHGNAVVM